MCKSCIHTEIMIKNFFLQLNYKLNAINKYILHNYTIRCLKDNKNYLRNYIIYNLEQMPQNVKCEILEYINQVA